MNVFVLDHDVVKAAQYHVDKHVNKMVTETAQLLSSAYYSTDQRELAVYKLSHYNHPYAKWARGSKDNWVWLTGMGMAIYAEYRYRYGNVHLAGEKILKMMRSPPNLSSRGYTPMPLCMPEYCKTNSVVDSYRIYYVKEKSHLFRWTGRPVPYWVKELQGDE